MIVMLVLIYLVLGLMAVYAAGYLNLRLDGADQMAAVLFLWPLIVAAYLIGRVSKFVFELGLRRRVGGD